MAIKIDKATFAPRWLTPSTEQGKPDASEFKLRPLTGAQRLEILSGFDPKTRRFTGDAMRSALQVGVIDWKNVNDAEGKPKRFTTQELEKLPVELLAELFSELLDASEQTDEQAGES